MAQSVWVQCNVFCNLHYHRNLQNLAGQQNGRIVLENAGSFQTALMRGTGLQNTRKPGAVSTRKKQLGY